MRVEREEARAQERDRRGNMRESSTLTSQVGRSLSALVSPFTRAAGRIGGGISDIADDMSGKLTFRPAAEVSVIVCCSPRTPPAIDSCCGEKAPPATACRAMPPAPIPT